MNRFEFLRSQIERIRRFAASLTNDGERERFQQTEAEYQRELDALSAADTTSSDTSVSSDAIAAKSEANTAAPSDAIAASSDGDAIKSTNDTGPQKTD